VSHTPTSTESATHNHPIPCAACGYNIAGLPPEGICPECATSIWLSRNTHSLWNINPAARKGLRLGSHLLIFAHALLFLGPIPALLALAITHPWAPQVLVIAGLLTLIASGLASAAGILASIHSVYLVPEPILSPRYICLTVSGFIALITILAAASFTALLLNDPLSGASMHAGQLIGIWFSLAACVSTLFTIEWLGGICHAATKLLQQITHRQPFKPRMQALMTTLPGILGPIGGLISAIYCYRALRNFETLAAKRQPAP
jgi:uncharacterized membrane protein (DUF485 family)